MSTAEIEVETDVVPDVFTPAETETPAETPIPTPKPKAKAAPKAKAKSPAKAAPTPEQRLEARARASEAKAANRLKQIRRVADLFKLVSDPTRLHIFTLLSESERNVTELCILLGGPSQPAVSHHLALFRHSGMIEPRRHGKNNFYALTEAGRELVGVVKGLVGC